MIEKQMTKQELLDWIDFLYKDLLMDNVKVGGYYFNLSQLKELGKTKKEIDRKISLILEELGQLSKGNKKSASKAAQAAQNKLFNQLDNLHVNLNVKNKFGENILLPCTTDEFELVYKELLERKKDVEYFKTYSKDEVREIKSEDIPCFMWFLNDMVADIRDKFAGKI